MLLSPAQEERWGAVERTKRRVRTIGRGSLAGESVDLIELVDQLGVPDDAEGRLGALMARYEAELDRALEERNALQSEEAELMMPRGMDAEMRMDLSRVAEVAERVREASVRVRDVNRSYARQVRGVLTDELAEEFERLWREWSFPKVYAETYTSRVLRAAGGFEDLNDEQRERLGALSARYERELERANEAWVRAIEESDAAGNTGVVGGGGGEMMMVEMADEAGGPVDDARRARRDLNREYLAQVRGLLSPGQRSRLPEREVAQPAGGGAPGGRQMMFVIEESVEESEQ